MKTIDFTKYQSCGNDFIIIDSTIQNISLENKVIKNLCDRHYGIGCDQLLIISKINHQQYNYHIFNTDGSESFQCANGARCVIDYINKKYKLDNLKVDLITKDQKCYQGFVVNENLINLNLNQVLHYQSNIRLNDDIIYDYVDIGNRHAIIYFPELANLPQNSELIILVNLINQKYPNGININFYIKKDPHNIELVTYERGVGFTLSCGSGACATVYSLANAQQLDAMNVSNKGGNLLISINQNKEIEMIGFATKVFDGCITL